MAQTKTPAVTVDALIERDGKILLIKRKNEPFSGSWALPGGFVEYGETVEEALHREIAEETGLKVEISSLFNIYSDPKRDPRGHVISICYTGVGFGNLQAGDDAISTQFFSLDEIVNLNLAFDHDAILKEYMVK
jgi:8-oxo-dGTP diphosphatase